MSKSINLNDFLQKISQDIGAAKKPKFSKFIFKNENMQFDFNSFYADSGLGYYQSDIACRDFLFHSHEKGANYSFLFFNTGKHSICFKSDKKRFVLNKNEFWIGTMKEEIFGIHEFENKHYQTKCIALDTDLAVELGMLKGLNFKSEVAVKSFKIVPMQNLILNELANSYIYEGKMREIFMESKILEMIYRSFGKRKSDAKTQVKIDEDYMQTLEKARQILLNNMQNPPSIKELARLCATNEFKLKIGFKEYFGTTIYALLAGERLNLAKELLSRSDISVKEASKMVGYNSISHFAKIFKEKFDILPTECIRQKSFYC